MSKIIERIYQLAMPKWLHGSRFEKPAHSFAQKIKELSINLECRLRSNRTWYKPSSSDIGLWLDYKFVVRNPIPDTDPLLAYLISFLKPGQVFYDVGGYVGWYSIVAAKIIGHNGAVVSFEPSPESARLFRKHCKLNKEDEFIRVVEAACSDHSGVEKMIIYSTSLSSGNALRNVYTWNEPLSYQLPVPTITLDEFARFSIRGPDVIKIDVEGAELWVLHGARDILLKFRPTILLEIHAFAWGLFDTTEAKFRDFLKSVGYEAFYLSIPENPLESFPDYGHCILRPINDRRS